MSPWFGPSKTYKQRQRRRQAARIGIAFLLVGGTSGAIWRLRDYAPFEARAAAPSQTQILLATAAAPAPSGTGSPMTADTASASTDVPDPLASNGPDSAAWVSSRAGSSSEWLVDPKFGPVPDAQGPQAPALWSDPPWAAGLNLGLDRQGHPIDEPQPLDLADHVPAFMTGPRATGGNEQGSSDGTDSYFDGPLMDPDAADAAVPASDP